MSSAGVMTSSEFSTRKRASQLRVGRSILGGAMDFPREQNDDSAKRWRKSSHTQRRRVGHPGGGVLAAKRQIEAKGVDCGGDSVGTAKSGWCYRIRECGGRDSHTQRRRVGHPGGGVLAMEQHLDPLQARRCPLITVVVRDSGKSGSWAAALHKVDRREVTI